MERGIKFEYGFMSVNGIAKKKYYISEIPYIKDKCDIWDMLPLVYVRQFTGIKDVNGIEIYEGDNLNISIEDEDSISGNVFKYNGVVIYGKEFKSIGKKYVTEYPCSFTIFCKEWYKEEGLLGNSRHILEVVGNIYE